ncbi:S1 family peptidase [Porticoccus sp. GXU_MW_L64]
MVDPTEESINQPRLRCGVVDRYEYEFIDPYEKCIFPIFQRKIDRESVLAGTGFFIAPTGIFISASHVFEINYDEGDTYWVLYIDSEGREHDLDFSEIMIRPEGRDIALGQVAMGDLDHPIVSIMELQPEINEVMASFAFSHTLIHEIEEQNGEEIQRIQYRNHWELGKVEEVSHTGFWQTPGPAFRSTILVEGRASGGPVFNSNGFVVGVNCRGMSPDGAVPYSTASSLKGIRDLEIMGESIRERRKNIDNKPIARVTRI